MRVQYAIGLPTVGDLADARLLVELAVLAEGSGWDGIYLWDHVLYHDQCSPVVSTTVAAAAIAVATTRVRLLMVQVLPRRPVQLVARDTVSIDRLSAGRLTLVAAIGSMDLEYTAFGESAELPARGQALDTALVELCALWSGEPVRMSGGAEPVRMVPVPRQQPRIPIWCGGRWPTKAPLRRAARFDGALPTFAGSPGAGLGGPGGPDAHIAEFAAASTFLAQQRDGLADFDIAVEGVTEPSGAKRAIAPYAEHGLSWWIETMRRPDTGLGAGATAAARRRIAAGPPN